MHVHVFTGKVLSPEMVGICMVDSPIPTHEDAIAASEFTPPFDSESEMISNTSRAPYVFYSSDGPPHPLKSPYIADFCTLPPHPHSKEGTGSARESTIHNGRRRCFDRIFPHWAPGAQLHHRKSVKH